MSDIRKNHESINRVGEFERILLNSLERIENKQYKKGGFELVSESSIDIIREIDKRYYLEHFFNKVRMYQMHSIFYEIWSNQHQQILHSISFEPLTKFKELELIELQHRQIFFSVRQRLDEISMTPDINVQYENWSLVWSDAFTDLVEFRDFNVFLSQSRSKKKGEPFSLNSFSFISQEDKFRLVMLLALVIAIVFGTLFILKK